MDAQFYGANCMVITAKGVRFVIDDNLAALGAKSVTKADDVALFTSPLTKPEGGQTAGRLQFDGPGEYEVSDVSIVGIPAQAHVDEPNAKKTATMFKLIIGELSVLVTGHIYPELSDKQLEAIGMIDVMFVPVGGSGYTTDSLGALKLIKSVEPKLVVPTHYADPSLNFPIPQQDLNGALKDMGLEPKERVVKLKVKSGELSDSTQLIVLEKA